MVNYIQFQKIVDLKRARKYLLDWRIETLQKAIQRNPNSDNNKYRQDLIDTLNQQLKENDQE